MSDFGFTPKNNRDVPDIVKFDDMEAVAKSNYSPQRPIRIYSHGWNW